jgi:competence protein ComEC
MAMADFVLPRRPLPVLALGLVGTALLAQALGPGVLGALWLAGALIGALACRRSNTQNTGARCFDQSPAPWVIGALVLVGITGLRALPGPEHPEAQGTYHARWAGQGRELGDLDGHPVPVQIPAGFVLEGDRIQVHSSAQVVLYAAPPGELPTPHSWAADPGQIRRISAARPSFWRIPAPIKNLRNGLSRRLEQLEQAHNQGLAQALLLGRIEAVDPALKDRFTRTGTRHLLALSGLHVGLMWWLWMRPICHALASLLSLRFAGRGLPRGKQGLMAAVLQALALLLFLPILGGGTPALRATLALGFADCARQVFAAPGAPKGAGRRVDPVSIWALSLVLEILWDPSAVTSISLQLSYAATLGLILFWSPCQAIFVELWSRAVPTKHWESNSLGKPRHAAWPWLLRAGASYTLGGLLASIIATLSTLPFIWIHFGEWSPIGILATLVLLPYVAGGLLLGWAYAVLPWLIPVGWAAWPFAQIPRWLEHFDRWAFTPHLLPESSAPCIVILFLLAWLSLWMKKHQCAPRRRAWCFRMALGIAAFLFMPTLSPPRHMTAHVCDVGHGTAILVQMPCGRNWLFDAGSRDRKGVAKRALLPLLRRHAVTELHVVISHGDRDHQAALARIASRVKVLSYTGPDPSFGFEKTETLADSGVDWDLGTGWLQTSVCSLGRCRSRVLRGLNESGNEGSRNLWLECDGQAILLCGDAEDEGLANIFPQLNPRAPLAALLIPHHGSKQKNLDRLISHTRPAQVWFSASKRSPLAQNWPYPNMTTRWTARDGAWSMEFKPIVESAGNLLDRAPY